MNKEFLKAALKKKLPGEAAHNRMMNYVRPSVSEVLQRDPPPRKSAVLALLFERDGQDFITLIERQAYAGVHSAQISFPGGKKEDSDQSLQATALREAQEEVGVSPQSIEVLGEFSPLYIPPSNFLVYPYLGYIEKEPVWIKQEREVANIMHVSLATIFNAKSFSRAKVDVGRKEKIEVNAYIVQGKIVWGATAMMLSELQMLLGNK